MQIETQIETQRADADTDADADSKYMLRPTQEETSENLRDLILFGFLVDGNL